MKAFSSGKAEKFLDDNIHSTNCVDELVTLTTALNAIKIAKLEVIIEATATTDKKRAKLLAQQLQDIINYSNDVNNKESDN